jgi:hypothetical protein
MKISNETLQLLKNFSTINKGIFIEPGNVLRTRTHAVLAQANVKEEFPLKMGIYDLAGFLSVIGLFKDPVFDFGEKFLRIAEADGRAETRYAYAGEGMVTLPTKLKDRALPSEAIEFVLTEEQWSTISKAVGVYDKEQVKITSDGKTIRMATEDHKNPHGNVYSMVLDGDPHGMKCNIVFGKEHLHLMKGSYGGVVTPLYTIFKNTSGYDLTYCVAAEPTTATFGAAGGE